MNLNTPIAVGVPLILPVGDSVSPGGSWPNNSENVKGGIPTDAVSVWS
jgi:hypothetical protein